MPFIQATVSYLKIFILLRRCEEEGIIFIGPTSEHFDMFGDKVKAREQAEKAGIPVIPGSDGPVADKLEEVETIW
jgi:pyruvate carboxylase